MTGAATRHPANANQAGLSLVLGLGATGLSCARHLSRRGRRVRVLDSRETPPQLAELRRDLPGVDVQTGSLDVSLEPDVDQVVLSPGLSRRTPLVLRALERGLPVVGDIELFARVADAPVAAVTGSNGKSTVTTMLARMAEAAGRHVRAGGNLGPPALDLLGDGAPDLYVLELSSFQLESTESLAPAAATVLNVAADHMDRHGTLDEYADIKARIFRNASVAVVNRDDPRVAGMAAGAPRRVTFGAGPAPEGHYGVQGKGPAAALARGARALMPVDRLPVPGRHNVMNALAALAMGEALGLDEAAMLSALAAYTGLPHRTQVVARRDGVTWIDDSKATNAGAAVAAIEGLGGPVVLIAGGEAKETDFAPLARALSSAGRAAVLIGRDAELLAGAVEGACPVHRATDMSDAVARAAALAEPGDSVLLSPACASFDMFDDYRARGDAFAEAVREVLA